MNAGTKRIIGDLAPELTEAVLNAFQQGQTERCYNMDDIFFLQEGCRAAWEALNTIEKSADGSTEFLAGLLNVKDEDNGYLVMLRERYQAEYEAMRVLEALDDAQGKN